MLYEPKFQMPLISSWMDWSSYIISIPKTASKKMGALICSVKFLSPEAARISYKNWYAGLLVLHLLPLSNPIKPIVEL